jgi:hypothetical protein
LAGGHPGLAGEGLWGRRRGMHVVWEQINGGVVANAAAGRKFMGGGLHSVEGGSAVKFIGRCCFGALVQGFVWRTYGAVVCAMQCMRGVSCDEGDWWGLAGEQCMGFVVLRPMRQTARVASDE